MANAKYRVARPLRGREAQCVLCGRVFTSDAMCEKHKRYRDEGAKRGREFSKAQCVDPSSIGMVERPASSDRPFTVWTLPVPEEAKWWNNSAPVERNPIQTLTCRQCGTSWERPAQRGRPPVVCADCKASAAG